MGCCDDCLTCDIAFNAVMSLSRASTRGSYSRIEGVTGVPVHVGVSDCETDNAENARMHETNTYANEMHMMT